MRYLRNLLTSLHRLYCTCELFGQQMIPLHSQSFVESHACIHQQQADLIQVKEWVPRLGTIHDKSPLDCSSRATCQKTHLIEAAGESIINQSTTTVTISSCMQCKETPTDLLDSGYELIHCSCPGLSCDSHWNAL